MADVDERLARIELLLGQLLELVHGGPSTPWSKTIRGRLHEVENLVRAADNLADAARQMRRHTAQRWSTTSKVVALLCSLAVALAPYVLFFLTRGQHN